MTSPWRRLRAWLLDSPGATDLAPLAALVTRSTSVTESFAGASDHELRDRVLALPSDFVESDAGLSEYLAVVRELARRHVGLRPFDVQLQAAAAMLRGTSIELATGEGKTLVGAIVAAGLVRTGHRVHVLSANDYLAERDAGWMGPLLRAAGVDVAFVTSRTPREDRRRAYQAEVVYVPVTEAGFDVLRDRIVLSADDEVGIGHDAAVVDEADAVLLDEGRVPLVLAGESARTSGPDWSIDDLANSLREGSDFEVDADRRTLHLTEAGLQRIEAAHPGADLFGADQDLLTRVNVALYAHALLTRDVDYVVDEGRVRLISQSRGRVEALQRWPEGLQDAVEAKERLDASATVEVLDQLLVSDLIGAYSSVVGMSATLVTASDELKELYELRCGALPANRECIRIDHPDELFETLEQRDAAAAEYVHAAHAGGQPILVATQSVAESERFASLLRGRGLEPVVLNARNDREEAEIVALAGTLGRITVSTQMAGRGTDIRLGDGAADRGGLCIVGIGRFPSVRLDGQLRGRAGRQGDPGSSRFFTSLQDTLVAEFAAEHPSPSQVGPDGRVRDRRLADLTDHAQRISDGQQRDLRKLARRYGKLPALQRAEILALRRDILTTDRAVTELSARLPELTATLRATLAPGQLENAARLAWLTSLDRRWSEHLAFAVELREGIHLRALAREEPLSEFNRQLVESYHSLVEQAREDAAGLIRDATISGDTIELDPSGIYRPGATWTYMVTDDHFGSEWARVGAWLAARLRS